MGQQNTPADRLLELTRAMLAGAGAGEWARVIELEAERRTVMDDLFGGGAAMAMNAQTRAGVQEMLDMDKQTMDLLEQCRSELGCQIRDLASRRKARAAYAANSR